VNCLDVRRAGAAFPLERGGAAVAAAGELLAAGGARALIRERVTRRFQADLLFGGSRWCGGGSARKRSRNCTASSSVGNRSSEGSAITCDCQVTAQRMPRCARRSLPTVAVRMQPHGLRMGLPPRRRIRRALAQHRRPPAR
jgi:hypothetical protein